MPYLSDLIPDAGLGESRQVLHVRRGDDWFILTVSNCRRLSSENHVSVKGFIFRRWTTRRSCFCPEPCRQQHRFRRNG